MNITDIERLTVDVMRRHGCHTAILYGSWVRGQATPQSDVDILCVRDAGPAFRDARVADGIFAEALRGRGVPDDTYQLLIGSGLEEHRVRRPLDGCSWSLFEFDDFIDLGLNPRGGRPGD